MSTIFEEVHLAHQSLETTCINMHVTALFLFSMAYAIHAAPSSDLVTKNLPGFPMHTFPVYSGFLNVSDVNRVSGYDRLIIHYQFDVSSSSTSKADPVAVWHTGGPGGSSIYGLYGEMGFFQVNNEGTETNRFSFNRAANMLYLESPAGSFLSPMSAGSGFSYCERNGQREPVCNWNDTTQAAAYTLTLEEFYRSFPEFAANPLYLIGESYAGQYIPNIAHYIITNSAVDPSLKARLQGIAVGNGCWGGDADNFMCNGPNENRDLVALYYGKGLISNKLHKSILAACKFPDIPVDSGTMPHVPSAECETQLSLMDKAVGPHDVYDVYDNCPDVQQFYEISGHSARTLGQFLHRNGHRIKEAHQELRETGGGYDWTCGQFYALPKYFNRTDVKKVLHLPEQSLSSAFNYNTTGPASLTLYPSLIQSGLRVLIYNGDADTCVPYIGNEEWTTSMVEKGVVEEEIPWHPWFADEKDSSPAGYATNYRPLTSNPGGGGMFAFVTIRLAGHEVPHFTPRAAFALFKRYLAGEAF